jgi:GT2 family glycosyltransferase
MHENGGPSRARNAGALEARGEILFFVDADVVVHRGAVARVASFLETNGPVAAVFGSYDDDPSERGVLTEYRNLLHHFVHQTGNRRASTFWSGCGAIRRDVFRRIGGFDEAGHPRCIEDIELGYRLRAAGHEIALDPGLQCTHLKRWTLTSWIGTDVFCRAIPWATLNLRRGSSPDDLNIARRQKLSVLLTLLGVGLLPLATVRPIAAPASALAVAAVIGLNHRLFRFLCRSRGPTFALRCVPLHLTYFLYSGLGFAYAWLMHRIGLRPHDWNAPRT